MKSIDVCLSPELMHLYNVQDSTVVVVDILRATSCMTTALAHGVAGITPVANLDECRNMKGQQCYTAGERNGEKMDGFDLGNSPFEYMDDKLKGKHIAYTTTNGTQAITKAHNAREIIIGSFLNLSSVVNHLSKSEHAILVVCSGWKGRVNLEDTIFAGALVEKLKDLFDPACDAPVMAQRLYQSTEGDLIDAIRDSSHVKRLKRLNIHEDIAFCMSIDKYDVLPVMRSGVLIAGEEAETLKQKA